MLPLFLCSLLHDFQDQPRDMPIMARVLIVVGNRAKFREPWQVAAYVHLLEWATDQQVGVVVKDPRTRQRIRDAYWRQDPLWRPLKGWQPPGQAEPIPPPRDEGVPDKQTRGRPRACEYPSVHHG